MGGTAGRWRRPCVPFRWDITRREQLGSLARGEPATSYPGFLDDLRRCCARVIAIAGDARLVFIGRSPESLFDYLSGALAGTRWVDRLALLNLSLWFDAQPNAVALTARATVGVQFDALGMDPAGIAASPRPVALVDLVASGGTLASLVELILAFAADAGVDAHAVRRRLRIVGITQRAEGDPDARRWQQRVRCAAPLRPSALKSVSVPWRLWDYLGNDQAKVAQSNPPSRWADPEMQRPPRAPEHAAALRLAVALYALGRTRAERVALARAIVAEGGMRHRALRTLASELRFVNCR
jgi:hypothetical protein